MSKVKKVIVKTKKVVGDQAKGEAKQRKGKEPSAFRALGPFLSR
jgi:hypothetical protein